MALKHYSLHVVCTRDHLFAWWQLVSSQAWHTGPFSADHNGIAISSEESYWTWYSIVVLRRIAIPPQLCQMISFTGLLCQHGTPAMGLQSALLEPHLWYSQLTQIAEDVHEFTMGQTSNASLYRTFKQLCRRTWTEALMACFGFCGSDHTGNLLRWSALAPTGSVKLSPFLHVFYVLFHGIYDACHIVYILLSRSRLRSNRVLRERVNTKSSVSTFLVVCLWLHYTLKNIRGVVHIRDIV